MKAVTTVRPMTGDDEASVKEILRATAEFTPLDKKVAVELVDSYLCQGESSGYHILVAEIEQAVAGYICYGWNPLTEGTWDIYWVAVAGAAQGKGVGMALMALAERSIRNAQGRLIIVETSSLPSYERARLFYERLGYRTVCQIPDFYGPGDDQVVFYKRLD